MDYNLYALNFLLNHGEYTTNSNEEIDYIIENIDRMYTVRPIRGEDGYSAYIKFIII